MRAYLEAFVYEFERYVQQRPLLEGFVVLLFIPAGVLWVLWSVFQHVLDRGYPGGNA